MIFTSFRAIIALSTHRLYSQTTNVTLDQHLTFDTQIDNVVRNIASAMELELWHERLPIFTNSYSSWRILH